MKCGIIKCCVIVFVYQFQLDPVKSSQSRFPVYMYINCLYFNKFDAFHKICLGIGANCVGDGLHVVCMIPYVCRT